jgi:exodeoxyribonuclease VII large subunit
MTEHLTSRRTAFGGLAGRLHALSPLATLERGYAVARDASGRTLASAADFKPDGEFTLRVRDGEVDARVRSIRAIGGGTA